VRDTEPSFPDQLHEPMTAENDTTSQGRSQIATVHVFEAYILMTDEIARRQTQLEKRNSYT